MNETIDNLVAYQPSPDALAEISVETNNYSADTGNVAGAVISNVIKSGTNSFHGNAFVFYRNSSMDANSWSNNRSSAPKPERRQDIFGGTFGGPLVKSKLFFFANYQGTRFDAPGFETISVAPATWRAGDLSSITTTIRDPATGVAFAGNQIPLGRISPIARAILSNTSLYPLPNRVVTGVTGNYVGENLTTISANQGDVRVDWSASTNDKIFGRFSYAGYESRTDKRAFPLLLGSVQDRPVSQPGVQLEPHRQPDARQRAARRLQPDHDCRGHARLGRHWRRQCGVRDRGRSADRRSQRHRMGQWTHRRGRQRDRHRHARQDVSDQREADLAQGPTHGEESAASFCTTSSSGSTPATTDCSGSSPTAGRSPARRSPISCSIRCRARGAAASRRPGRTCTTASRCSFRTTSS